jgi:hypothetical protein
MTDSDPAAEAWVDLPPQVEEPFEVYVRGVRQVPGEDYELVGRALVFSRPLSDEGRLGTMRWISMFLGVAGTYRKDESVDIVYEHDGKRTVETGLKPRAD